MRYKKNGFTLIELLAVIAIISILLGIAIPVVSGYIERARKKAFVGTVKSIVDGVKYEVLNNGSYFSDGKDTEVFDLTEVEIDGGRNTVKNGTLTVTRTEKNDYIYYVRITEDENNWCLSTNMNKISEKSVKNCSDENEFEYEIGDVISYANTTWRVIKNSPFQESYVTVLKSNVLTASEMTSTYARLGTDDTMAFYWDDNCHFADTYGSLTYSDEKINTGCAYRNNYEGSKMKEMLENAYMPTINPDNLAEVDGYKIRLLKYEELINQLGYVKDPSPQNSAHKTSKTPSWVYDINCYYWTMSTLGSSSKYIWTVTSNSKMGVYIPPYNRYSVRPVINIKKEAIVR